MIKKLIALLLALVMVFGMVACGAKTEAPAAAAPEAEAASKEEVASKEEAVPEEETAPEAEAVSDPNETEYYVIDSNTDVADAFDTVWWNATDLCGIMLFDRLIQCDTEGNPVNPQLAEKFESSADNLVHTFTLRQDVKWHDGEAFTAEDVEWSIMTALATRKIAPVIYTQLANIKGAQAYIACKADSVSGVSVDGNVVTIELDRPSSMFMEAMSQFAPLPKHLLEGEDTVNLHTSEFWQAPVGNGAYKFKDFVVGEYFTFERFDDYYGAKAVIKNVKSLIIGAGDHVVKAQANELDYIQTCDPATIEEVLLNPNYTGNAFPVYYTRQISYNTHGYNGTTDGTRMSDIRVRQALNYALDIPAIVEAIYGEYGTPIYTYVAPGTPGYTDDVEKYEYNPEKAKQLLEEAGFDFNEPIRIIEYFGDPTTYALLDMIIYYFEQIGVKAEYFNCGADANASLNEIRDYDLQLNAWNAGVSRGTIYSALTATDPIRSTYRTNLDELYAQMCAAPTLEEQTELFEELQKAEAEFCFTIPLCTLKCFCLVNTAKLNTGGVNFLGDGFNYDRGFDKLSFNADYFS